MLSNQKDDLHLITPRSYSIPCSCGKEYIGETGRLMVTRIKEHQGDVIRIRTETSTVAVHFYSGIDHTINMNFKRALCCFLGIPVTASFLLTKCRESHQEITNTNSMVWCF